MKRVLLFLFIFIHATGMDDVRYKRLKVTQEKLIEEVQVPVECRYCASRGTKVEFPSLQEELRHILDEHGIIASDEVRFEKYENIQEQFQYAANSDDDDE